MAVSFLVEGLQFSYPNLPRRVLDGVRLSIPPGGTTVVLGLSGAGKSTLLYLLGLLWDRPLEVGRIEYEGDDYNEMSRAEKARLRRDVFGFALQSCYLLPHFTCAENILMNLALSGHTTDELVSRPGEPADPARRVDQLVGRVDLTGKDGGHLLLHDMHKMPAEVSGGQKQRYSVVRAVVHDPQVVFADEPFSSLDTGNTDAILDLLEQWRDGQLPHSRPDAPPRTLLLVCHDLDVAYERGDRFVFVTREGKVAQDRCFSRDEIGGPEDLRGWVEGGPVR